MMEQFEEIIPVHRIASMTVAVCTTTMTLKQAISIAVHNKLRRLPVLEDMKVVGILTVMDILQCLHDLGIKEALETSVDQVMTREVFGALPTISVKDAAQKILESPVTGMLLHDSEGVIAGIVTISDFIRASQFFEEAEACQIKKIMRKKVATIPNQATVKDLLSEFISKNEHRLVKVNESRKVVGILTTGDVLNYISKNFVKEEADIMNMDGDTLITKNVRVVMEDEDLSSFYWILKHQSIGGCPVVNSKEELVGMIDEHNLFDFLAEEGKK